MIGLCGTGLWGWYVQFRLLGPLVVESDGGERTAVGGARLRVLLAALLLHANRPVSSDALADLVWDGSPPPGAAVTLRGHVLRLRRSLGPEAAARITSGDASYSMRVAEAEVDALEFEALCEQAGAHSRAGAWPQVSAAAARALELWRASPLTDVASQQLRDRFVPRLEQRRLELLEDRIEAELHLGGSQSLVPELRSLIAAHPLRERLYAQLMRALAVAGRRAEALTAYQEARRVLIDELGIEPGTQLRSLQERILAGEPVQTTPPVSPPPDRARTAVVPRQLPATVAHFAGRDRELKALAELQGRVGRRAGETVLSVIHGSAGIGKTTLAIHWGQQMADRFPDGQLYLNLRGFDPSGTPVDVPAAVRAFLDALTVSPGLIPVDLPAQLALYRSLTAGRRMLVVLDNARDESQVRALLPSSGGCLTLVTSRNQLTGLVALDGAVPISVDLLTDDEARDLLVRRLGRERVAREQQAADELIGQCARLPLALNIVAARAALQPDAALSGLVERLRETRRRLDLLSAGESAADVRAVFSWSLGPLGSSAARMFRLLGLHPGPDIGIGAAAALAGVDDDAARQALDELTAANLLTEHTIGRYGFHDLLRAYAAEQAHAREPETQRRAALHRVFDHYLHTVWHATVLAYTPWSPPQLAEPVPGSNPRRIADRPQVITWFETERNVLFRVAATARESGFGSHTWKLAWGTGLFLTRMGYRSQWLAWCRTALAAAEEAEDPLGQFYAHRWLGEILVELGEHDQAHVELGKAMLFCEGFEDSRWQVNLYLAIGRAFEIQGEYAQAIGQAQRAVELCRSTGYPSIEAQALNAVGWYHTQLGQDEQALPCCRRALDLAREAGDQRAEAATLDSLGLCYHHLGRHTESIDHYRGAVRLRRILGDRSSETGTLIRLGDSHRAAGEPARAAEAWRQALEILEELEHPDAETVRAKLRELDG